MKSHKLTVEVIGDTEFDVLMEGQRAFKRLFDRWQDDLARRIEDHRNGCLTIAKIEEIELTKVVNKEGLHP